MTRVKFLNKWVAYISLGIIVLSVGQIMYWLYSVPTNAIDVRERPIPVLAKTTQAGDFIPLHFDYCKLVKATGRVTTALVGQTTQLMLPTGNEAGNKGCVSINGALPIPPQATPGKYHFHFRATYQVNPLRSVVQEYDTESFEVR